MKLPRPRGRWATLAEAGLWVLAGALLTAWVVSIAEEPVPRWRVVGALALVAAIGVVDRGNSRILERLAERTPWAATLVSAAIAVAGVAAYAAMLGVLRQFGPALFGVALGHVLGARSRYRDRRPDDSPLWPRHAGVDSEDDGRRWRTGAP